MYIKTIEKERDSFNDYVAELEKEIGSLEEQKNRLLRLQDPQSSIKVEGHFEEGQVSEEGGELQNPTLAPDDEGDRCAA